MYMCSWNMPSSISIFIFLFRRSWLILGEVSKKLNLIQMVACCVFFGKFSLIECDPTPNFTSTNSALMTLLQLLWPYANLQRKTDAKTFIIESSFSLSCCNRVKIVQTAEKEARTKRPSKWRIFWGYAQWPNKMGNENDKTKWEWEKVIKFLVLKCALLLTLLFTYTNTQSFVFKTLHSRKQ